LTFAPCPFLFSKILLADLTIVSSDARIAIAFGIFSTLISLLSLWIGYLTWRATVTQSRMSILPLFLDFYSLFMLKLTTCLVASGNINDNLANEHGLILRHEHTHFTAQIPMPRQSNSHKLRWLE
jgi:hypothetical protein